MRYRIELMDNNKNYMYFYIDCSYDLDFAFKKAFEYHPTAKLATNIEYVK